MATNLIPWPTYTHPPAASRQAELMAMSIQLEYPGQRVVESEFTNNQMIFNVSPGEFRGSVTIRNSRRNSNFHNAVRTFMAELKDNPHDNYTLIPWEMPSIYSLNSTILPTSPAAAFDNAMITSLISVSGGIALLEAATIAAGEDFVVSVGEHFGYNRKTYRITSATKVPGSERWNIRTVPQLANTTVSSPVYKRVLFPARMNANSQNPDSIQGSQVEGFQLPVIEARVN